MSDAPFAKDEPERIYSESYDCGKGLVPGTYNAKERKLVFASPTEDRRRSGIKLVYTFDLMLDRPESITYVRGIDAKVSMNLPSALVGIPYAPALRSFSGSCSTLSDIEYHISCAGTK